MGFILEKVRFLNDLGAILLPSVMRKRDRVVPRASVLPRLRVMCGRDAALGPGRVQLLELIGETGSLRAAAERMGMAYMTAWMHVRVLNRRFRSPVVVAQRGVFSNSGSRAPRFPRAARSKFNWVVMSCHPWFSPATIALAGTRMSS